MTPDELQDAIATLQRDLAETMLELGETRRRVLVLEEAREAERLKRGRGTGRFRTGYRDARGAYPWEPGDEPAEVTIGRMRGGGGQ